MNIRKSFIFDFKIGDAYNHLKEKLTIVNFKATSQPSSKVRKFTFGKKFEFSSEYLE